MEEVETVSMFASTLVSAVVDRDITLNKYMARLAKAKWLSGLEVDLGRVLLSAPATVEGVLLRGQIMRRRGRLVGIIVDKYVDLNSQYGKILDGELQHPCPLLHTAMTKYTDEKKTSSAVDSAIVRENTTTKEKTPR